MLQKLDVKNLTESPQVRDWLEKKLSNYEKPIDYNEVQHLVHWLEQYKSPEIINMFSVDKVRNSAKK